MARAVTEMIRHHVRAVSDDDEDFFHARRVQSADDVVQDGPAAHGQHGLWNVEGEFAHARTAPGGEQDGFFYWVVTHGRVAFSSVKNSPIKPIAVLICGRLVA